MTDIKKETPRGVRNCNPLNIRRTKSHWAGLTDTPSDTSFCQFKSMVWGWRAAFKLLRSYYYKYSLRTVRGIATRWAPPADHNNTNMYIELVCTRVSWSRNLNIGPDDTLPDPDQNPFTWGLIVEAMAKVETGWDIQSYSSWDELFEGWHLMELSNNSNC